MKLEEIETSNWIFRDATINYEITEKFLEALEILDVGTIEHAEILLREVVAECPDHIDAIYHLSLIYGEQGRETEAYVFCQAAVGIGLQAIPRQFDWRNSKLEWWNHDNRPFMRAYHSLGIWRVEQCKYDDAIEIFKRLLSVNPNDHQGVRYWLPICWFEKGELSKIIFHCRMYSDDIAPEIHYSEALALARIGRDKDARAALENCVSELPLVGKELLKEKHFKPPQSQLPRSLENCVTHGGADQAYYYWKSFGKYWSDSESAMELLNQVVKNGS